MRQLLVNAQSESYKIFIRQSGRSVHLAISSPERVREPLDLDAGNDEIVQG